MAKLPTRQQYIKRGRRMRKLSAFIPQVLKLGSRSGRFGTEAKIRTKPRSTSTCMAAVSFLEAPPWMKA
jgi:hypothetical protein